MLFVHKMHEEVYGTGTNIYCQPGPNWQQKERIVATIYPSDRTNKKGQR